MAKDCKDALRKGLKKENFQDKFQELNDKEQKVLDDFFDKKKEMNIQTLHEDLLKLREKHTSDDAFRKAVKKHLDARREESLNVKIEMINNQRTVAKQLSNINQEGFKNSAEGLHATLIGTTKNVDNATMNVDTLAAMKSDLFQGVIAEEMGPYAARIKDGSMDVAIMDAIERGFPADIDPHVEKVARTYKKLTDMLHTEKSDAGFNLGYIDDYIMKRTYDVDKMLVNPERARTLFKDIVDKKDMFGDRALTLKEQDDILDTMIDDMFDRNLMKGFIDTDKIDKMGRSSLEARVTQSRKVKFKKGGFAQWNAEFGRANLLEGLISEAKTTAKQLALREVWGANPKANYQKVKQKLIKEANAAGNTELVEQLQKGKVGLFLNEDHIWANLDGRAQRVGSTGLANFMGNMRSLIYMKTLGGSTITAMTDVAPMAAMLKANVGTTYLEGFGEIAKQMAGFTGDVAKEIVGKEGKKFRKAAKEFGIFIETGTGAMYRHMGVEGGGNRFMAKMTDFYTKMNPIGLQTAFHQASLTTAHSHFLMKALDSGNVEGAIASSFKRAGFDESYYPALKSMKEEIRDGVVSLTPSKAKDIPDEIINPLLADLKAKSPSNAGLTAKKLKRDIELKLRSLYTETANNAVPKPGLREQAILNQGLAPGTLSGEMMKSFSMLKSFALKMSTVMKRVADASEGRNDTIKNVSSYVIALTGAGYGAMSLKEMANGRTPPDPFKAETIKESIVKGGAGGLWGDMIMGAFDTGGRSYVTSLVGPIAQPIDDTAKMMSKAAKGELSIHDIGKFGVKNAPGGNLFYAKPMLNYMFLDSYLDAHTPGRKKRLRKRMKERGQRELFD